MAQNKIEYLLGCLSEEGHEVGKNAIKAQRFGMQDKEPGQDRTNAQRIVDEFRDMHGVMEYLAVEGAIEPFYLASAAQLELKRRKIDKYMALGVGNREFDDRPSKPEKMTADELMGIIRRWLDAEDATHFGRFERLLDAAVMAEEDQRKAMGL